MEHLPNEKEGYLNAEHLQSTDEADGSADEDVADDGADDDDQKSGADEDGFDERVAAGRGRFIDQQGPVFEMDRGRVARLGRRPPRRPRPVARLHVVAGEKCCVDSRACVSTQRVPISGQETHVGSMKWLAT